MPDLTPNLGLIKPLDGEPGDIDAINANMDTIDNNVPGAVYRHMYRHNNSVATNHDSWIFPTELTLDSQSNFPDYSNGEWTIPRDGRYLVHGSCRWRVTAGREGGIRQIAIYVNGSAVREGSVPGAQNSIISSVTASVSLNVGDIVTFRMKQTSGGSIDVMLGERDGNYFSIDLIGPR